MSEKSNKQSVEEIYAAFGRGDIEFILNTLAGDFDWYHPREQEIPWGGRRKTRDEVAQFFVAIASNVDIEVFEPQEFTAGGDNVFVTGREKLRSKATGKTCQPEWIHKWTLRDGKVTAWREYTDTASVAEMFRS